MFLSQSCLINTLRLYREAFFLSITVQKYSYEYNYFHFTLNYNTKLTIVQLLKSIKSKLWFLSIFEHFSAPDSYVLNKHLLLFALFLKELLINAQISVPFFLRCKKTYAHKRPVKSLKIWPASVLPVHSVSRDIIRFCLSSDFYFPSSKGKQDSCYICQRNSICVIRSKGCF